VLKGQCLCGAIKYETSADPGSQANCHCSMCRRASGASPVAWFTVPISSFRFTSGSPCQYQSSEHIVRTFCGHCGTPLTFQSKTSLNEIDITACSLDTPELAAPKSHIYTSSKLDWCLSRTGCQPTKTVAQARICSDEKDCVHSSRQCLRAGQGCHVSSRGRPLQ
jgi:hypothetical protein